jgi:acyl-CoA synthetase (AMP-forming)/AMP-acid ligase II
MTAPWTYAAIWESVAAALPGEAAFIQGDARLDWRDFDGIANGLAAEFLGAGLGHQAKIAVYTQNCAEYLTAYFAAFKAGMVPINVNYRYGPEEIAYLLDNADAEAVVFEAGYADTIAPVRAGLPGVKRWIAIARDGEPIPDWAISYSSIAPVAATVVAPWGRSGDDMMFIYTGGTTGMPKGVMWRQGDLLGKGAYGANPLAGVPPLESPESAGPRALATPVRPRAMIAPPLMHGTGMLTAMAALVAGGTVLLLPQGHFSPDTLWDIVDTHRASRITVVGQPFAQPLLDALEANPGRWNVSCVAVITSSGAMWGRENKLGLIRHMPQVMLTDAFSSSEALGLGTSIMTGTTEVATAAFALGPDCALFTEAGARVVPGSGERGRVAVSGYLPAGYYKDPVKSAATFPTIEGRQWSIPGDWATIAADGTLTLLGRGSQCINTGGEKVFPEEVEEVLKRHPAVRDAAVTGLPDPRFGERIAALVDLRPGATEPGADELIQHVKALLSHYKAPRHVLVVDSVARAPNGKLDYKVVKERALAAFAMPTTPTGD